jgi:hypothetical protein
MNDKITKGMFNVQEMEMTANSENSAPEWVWICHQKVINGYRKNEMLFKTPS